MARETTEAMRQQLVRIAGQAAFSFTDESRESFLDTHAERLVNHPIYGHGGSGSFYLYGTPYTHWEDGATVTDPSGEVVEGTLDALTGVFSPADPNPSPVLYLSGTSFDIYASAVDMIEGAAGLSGTQFDVSIDGNTYNRSQVQRAFLELAAIYRKRVRAKIGQSAREDEQWG
jgi:hypothetical protein